MAGDDSSVHITPGCFRNVGRWHDNRHTLITDLAESGAGDETIRDIAGHVSKQMLKHYPHIRMEAKRRALEVIVAKPDPKANGSADSGTEQAVKAAATKSTPPNIFSR